MNDIETFELIVRRAMAAGWHQAELEKSLWNIHPGGAGQLILCIPNLAKGTKLHLSESAVLFDPPFAKALWGEEPCEVNGDDRLFGAPIWQYHLQQMVIADDRLQYARSQI